MGLRVSAFRGLLLAVGVLRLAELRISKRHQREMAARGAAKVEEPKFRWMVLLHPALLLGAALEVVLLKRPFIPSLAVPMLAVFLAANAVRCWAIRSLGEHWDVQDWHSSRVGAGP